MVFLIIQRHVNGFECENACVEDGAILTLIAHSGVKLQNATGASPIFFFVTLTPHSDAA